MVGIILTLVIPIAAYLLRRRHIIRSNYEMICKKSSSLKPIHILNIRPFADYYYKRKEDITIKDMIINGKNILIIGPPLAGKSRSIYQALKTIKKPLNIIKPSYNDIEANSFINPWNWKSWRQKILLLDDLQILVEKQNYDYLLRKFLYKGVQIIAACRSGEEYEKTVNRMLINNLDPSTIFGNKIVELQKISEKEGKEIAKQSGKNWIDAKFDGTPGSIFMTLSEKKNRFNQCTPDEKNILKSLKILYLSGIFIGRNKFSLKHIQSAFSYYGDMNKLDWSNYLSSLQKKELIYYDNKNVATEEIYLENIIQSEFSKPKLDVLNTAKNIFKNEPEVLIKIANKAFSISFVEKKKLQYLKFVISFYNEIVETHISDKPSTEYASIQHNLGIAYAVLAELDNRKENCINAIQALKNALKIYDVKKFPFQFGSVQLNLGNSFGVLASVENQKENSKSAIFAYRKAFNVFTVDKYPIEYALARQNEGNAYIELSEAENKKENIKKGIKSFKESLNIYTYEKHPFKYAMVQNNIGMAFGSLSEIEDKKINLDNALDSNKEALKVYTKENIPIKYAMVHSNLGNIYKGIAEIEDPVRNTNWAISSFKETQTIYNKNEFPLQYAMVHLNLGAAYQKLAQFRNTLDNCKKAIVSIEKALEIYTLEEYPRQYAAAKNNIGTTYGRLSDVENKEENATKALLAFNEILSIYTKKEFPFFYARTQLNIGRAYRVLAEIKNSVKNCEYSIKAYDEALIEYEFNKFPMQNASARLGLGITYIVLAYYSERALNSKKAISSLNDALIVYTKEKFQYEYAQIQMNLSDAYKLLASVEDRGINLRNSKEAHDEGTKEIQNFNLGKNFYWKK